MKNSNNELVDWLCVCGSYSLFPYIIQKAKGCRYLTGELVDMICFCLLVV